ncbi:hypothetical protein V1264_003324 [Littorina saxatilis]|uniref:Apple domain-containing protein n=1 Tax=Littorina saxatilis TaxID=31220 RepID=A0AAN9G860_9CAEN
MTSQSHVTNMAVTYSLLRGTSAWVDNPCIVNSDCPEVKKSECFKGRCLCVPGYYYSSGRDSCVQTCSSCRLAPSYLRYPNSTFYIPMSYVTPAALEDQDCLNACSSQTSCRSIGYNQQLSTKCYMKELAVLDSPSDWTPDSANIDYYQRTCA